MSHKNFIIRLKIIYFAKNFTKMKKILLAILIFATSSVFAQDKAFSIGLKVAPAMSWMGISNKYAENDGVRAKCNAGVSIFYNFHENFSFVTGLNVNSLGGKLKPTDKANGLLDEAFLKRYRITELELPLLIKMQTEQFNQMRYFLKVGFGVGAIVQARDSEKDKLDKKLYNTVLTSYIVGIGTEYEVARNVALVAELRFDGGISSFTRSKNIKNDVIKEFRSRCNFLELGLGVQF